MNARYSRQTILSQIGKKGQEILLNSKVIIVGCGALGTTVSNNLVRAGVGHLLIIDRDIIELNNLQRQILFDEGDVGTPKVVAAVKKLKKINSEIKIESALIDLNNTNIESTINGFDLVIDATDNIPTRMLINDVCVKNGIPWIYAGVISTIGMTMNILPGKACLRCFFNEIPKIGTLDTCETAGVLNTIPNIIASIESTEALKILLNKDDIEKRLIYYDVWGHTFKSLEVEKDKKCECCGKGDFKYLNTKKREIISSLCGRNAVQIIPPDDIAVDLNKIAETLEKVVHLELNELLLIFEVDEKTITVFKDGRAIIKGTEDKGVAKSIYSRYLGQ